MSVIGNFGATVLLLALYVSVRACYELVPACIFICCYFVCRLHAVCQPATRVTVNRQLDP